MGKMEAEEAAREIDPQANEAKSRRPYVMPVLERHDEWHLVTGLIGSIPV